jgi:enediyne biosynthesis protein E4
MLVLRLDLWRRFFGWLSLAITACASDWQNFPGGRWQPLEHRSGGVTGFCLLEPAETGVLFTNTLSEGQGATNRTLYNGSGVGTGDVDGDGLTDIVFAGLQNKVQLFKNLGGWRFTNITQKSGLAVTNVICRGVVLADINGDRAPDVLLSGSGGVRCWQNDGRGHFTDITGLAGTASPYASFTLALADIDGNGSIDVYVANNRAEDIRDRGEVQLQSVAGKLTIPATLRNRLTVFNGQVLEFGEPDILLLNDGTGRFRPVNWGAGTFLHQDGQRLRGAPLDWGLSATFRDLDGDGAPDLYVCNDFWTPDRIWINDGKGTFRAAPDLAFRQISGSSMGVDMADLDLDGNPEVFVVDMLSRSSSWRKRQMAAQPDFSNLPGAITNRPQSLRNTLFRARSDGTYEEIANYAAVSAAEWAWQPLFIDVDLDGHLDLLVSTGHAHDVQDRDARVLVKAAQKNYAAITNAAERQRQFSNDLLANMHFYPKLATPIVAFRNQGDLKFEDATESWGTSQPGIHHGMATADFDGDGDLDLVINNLNEPAGLYRNESSAPRVAIRLKGQAPNTEAIGALLKLHGQGMPVQRHEIVSGGRYLSGCDPLIVFAAKETNSSMALEIRWRNGKVRTVADIRPNRLYEIAEDPSLDGSAQPAKAILHPKWFNDASGTLSHVHRDHLYDDFLRQPLLPWRLSQLGPGIAWADLDADGWEDLILGTGAGTTIAVFRNDQKAGFSLLTNAPFNQPLPRDTSTILSLPLRSGETALLAGLASYEDARTNTACLFQFDPKAGGPMAILKDLPSSVGPLALSDIDADGELDLFVGARVRPGRWPEAGGSVLLKGREGAWQADPENSGSIASSNCVSSALWTDLNGDGYPELILAGEWSALRIYRNERGKLHIWNWPVRGGNSSSSEESLSRMTGLWSSITAGDFDGDGRLDLIAGNWGENGEQQASLERPLCLYAGSNGNRSLTLVETVYDPVRGAYTASRPLEELGVALNFLAGKYPTHRAYSEATIDELLGSQNSAFHRFEAATLKTILLLNRTTHFEVRALPREVQFAPVFGICIADFNLDGSEDIFLAQNFFATRPGVPRLDAGRGLLLRGDGSGNFSTVAGSESGLLMYGEQRGAAVADFDHDGKPDLVVTQNAAATCLFRNASRRSGLRLKVTGPPKNPNALGAIVRLRCGSFLSAAREIRSGTGYWSQDAPVQILAYPPEQYGDRLLLEVQFQNKTQTAELPRSTREYNFKLN